MNLKDAKEDEEPDEDTEVPLQVTMGVIESSLDIGNTRNGVLTSNGTGKRADLISVRDSSRETGTIGDDVAAVTLQVDVHEFVNHQTLETIGERVD